MVQQLWLLLCQSENVVVKIMREVNSLRVCMSGWERTHNCETDC